MLVRLNRDDLYRGVSITHKMVPSKPSNPVLGGILLKATDDGILEMVANDLEFSLSCRVSAEVITPGSVVLPARFLAELVRRLPSGAVELSVNVNHTATLRSHQLEVEVNGMDALDYPSSPRAASDKMATLDALQLQNAISQVSFAISNDESRPAMTGAFLKIQPDQSLMLTIDGFRLAEKRFFFNNHDQLECVIPGKILNELGKIISDTDEPLQVFVDRNHIIFTLAQITLTSRLIEADFPFKSSKDVIRTEPTSTVTLDVKVFMESLERALLIAREHASVSNIVKLEFMNNSLSISSNSPDLGSFREQIDTEGTGEDLTIAFNGRYLIDMLKAVGTQRLQCQFSGPQKAAVFRPVGDNNFVSVLSPIRI